MVGRLSWLTEQWSLTAPDELTAIAEQAKARAAPRSRSAWDGAVRGVIVVADTVKDTSAQAIAEFRQLGCARSC